MQEWLQLYSLSVGDNTSIPAAAHEMINHDVDKWGYAWVSK